MTTFIVKQLLHGLGLPMSKLPNSCLLPHGSRSFKFLCLSTLHEWLVLADHYSELSSHKLKDIIITSAGLLSGWLWTMWGTCHSTISFPQSLVHFLLMACSITKYPLSAYAIHPLEAYAIHPLERNTNTLIGLSSPHFHLSVLLNNNTIWLGILICLWEAINFAGLQNLIS